MSAPVAKTTEPAAEEQAQQVKQDPSEASEEPSEEVQQQTNGSTAMEVDSSQKESNPDSTAPIKKAKSKRRNDASPGAIRKRFKWLMEEGYARSAAAEIIKMPFKPKDAEKFVNETGFYKEKIDQVKEGKWDSLDNKTKRRIKWLMKQDFNAQDALRLATEPGRKSKRNLPANGNPLKPSANAGVFLVMALVAKGYPETLLTNAQTDELKSAILKEVAEQKDSEQKPHFRNSEHINGYLRVQCSDQGTRRWLQRTVGKLPAPEGISLKLIADKDILKGDVYIGLFPNSNNDPNETILEFIETQNDGIDISEWIVLTRKEIRDTQTIELKLSVDKESAKNIRLLGYELNYKSEIVKLWNQNPSGNPTDRVVPKPNQRSLKQPSRPFNVSRNRGGSNRFNQFNGRANPYGGFNNNRSMPNNNNGSFNFVDTLYDLISGGGDNNYNQWGGGNTGFNRNGPRRNSNPRGYHNFFTRSGFY